MGFLERIRNILAGSSPREDEIYWGLIFNSAIASSDWLRNKSFYPGRWAAGYPLLYVLYRIYNDLKPRAVLEFGLGETTKLLAQYKRAHPDACARVIEQDRNWLDAFNRNYFNIQEYSSCLELEKRLVFGKESYTYKGLFECIKDTKYDFVIVDGPWGSDQYSRYQIVDVVENDLLCKEFILVIDDFERPGEKQTVRKLKEALDRKNIRYAVETYSGERATLVICTPGFHLATSL